MKPSTIHHVLSMSLLAFVYLLGLAGATALAKSVQIAVANAFFRSCAVDPILWIRNYPIMNTATRTQDTGDYDDQPEPSPSFQAQSSGEPQDESRPSTVRFLLTHGRTIYADAWKRI